MISRIPNPGSIKKVLLIRLSSIGDVLHSSPVAQALREYLPEAHIAWIVESKSKDVILNNPYLDEIIVFPRKEWLAQANTTKNYSFILRNMNSFIRDLRERHFELAIDLQGLLKSAIISYLSGAPYRICYADTRELSYRFANIVVQPNAQDTVRERYLGLLRPLRIESRNLQMTMPLLNEDHLYADSLLNTYDLQPGGFIVFNPSASVDEKKWPAKYYAWLGDRLISHYGLPIIILGAPSDVALAKQVKTMANKHIIDISGQTTLPQLGAFVKKAAMFIGSDTGPLYIAEAVGTPTVSIFGPTDPDYYAPAGPNHIAVSPPDRRKKNCIEDIPVQKVFHAALQLGRYIGLTGLPKKSVKPGKGSIKKYAIHNYRQK